MQPLADRPELIGFFSYSRDDDEDFKKALTAIRIRIQSELRSKLGRSKRTLRLWQDEEAIAPGTLWSQMIDKALGESVFFIPIITPRVVSSKYCGLELGKFLEREKELGRDDLIFPILYIDVDELEDETVWRRHEVLSIIGARQYVDWREFRYEPDSVAAQRAISSFCGRIVQTLKAKIEPPPTRDLAPPKLEPNPASVPGPQPMPDPKPQPEPRPQPVPEPQPEVSFEKKAAAAALAVVSVIVAAILIGLIGFGTLDPSAISQCLSRVGAPFGPKCEINGGTFLFLVPFIVISGGFSAAAKVWRSR